MLAAKPPCRHRPPYRIERFITPTRKSKEARANDAFFSSLSSGKEIEQSKYLLRPSPFRNPKASNSPLELTRGPFPGARKSNCTASRRLHLASSGGAVGRGSQRAAVRPAGEARVQLSVGVRCTACSAFYAGFTVSARLSSGDRFSPWRQRFAGRRPLRANCSISAHGFRITIPAGLHESGGRARRPLGGIVSNTIRKGRPRAPWQLRLNVQVSVA